MAVRLDTGAVRAAVDPAVYHAAEEFLASGGLDEIVEAGGGAASSFADGQSSRSTVWAGVVDGEFTAECRCAAAAADPDELCVHAVAVTLGALDAGVAWSSAATPPSGTPGPADAAELAAVHDLIDGLAARASADGWGPLQVADAGEQIIEALGAVTDRSVSGEALVLVEHAATVWDALAVDLYDLDAAGDDGVDVDPEEIAEAMREIHLRVCSGLDLTPAELVERLAAVIDRAGAGSCLDEPEEYAELLGAAGVAALRARAET